MKIGVIGTGYVGLVTGSCFSYVGNKVFCVDIDKEKIKNLNNGDRISISSRGCWKSFLLKFNPRFYK